jgi:hypothetical protein
MKNSAVQGDRERAFTVEFGRLSLVEAAVAQMQSSAEAAQKQAMQTVAALKQLWSDVIIFQV